MSETGFVLHSLPYRETSLIVDLFSLKHGRLAVIAKGARRPQSALRAVLLQFQPIEFASDLRLEVDGQGPSITGDQLLQSLASITTTGLVVRNALRKQQSLDAIHMHDPLAYQRLALAAKTPAVLFVRGRWPNHGADSRFTALIGQQRAQQGLAIDPVRLGLAPPARGQDRGGVNDMAFDTLPFQHTVDPEAIQSSLMDDDNREGVASSSLRLRLQRLEVAQQTRHVIALDRMLRHPLAIAGRQ